MKIHTVAKSSKVFGCVCVCVLWLCVCFVLGFVGELRLLVYIQTCTARLVFIKPSGSTHMRDPLPSAVDCRGLVEASWGERLGKPPGDQLRLVQVVAAARVPLRPLRPQNPLPSILYHLPCQPEDTKLISKKINLQQKDPKARHDSVSELATSHTHCSLRVPKASIASKCKGFYYLL